MDDEWTKLKEEGNTLLKDGDLDGAIDKYTKALERCGDDVEARQVLYSNRSAAHLKKANHSQALQDAEECLNVNSGWAKGYSRKAAVLREMKKFAEASEVAQIGLTYESSNVALKTLHRACETSLVCNKLRGFWHGKVAEEVGGYVQVFDFWSDSDVRVAVLGSTVDAKYELDVFGQPYPHLDMSVPGSPGSAFVRHIYRFANDDELHLCSPYLRPPEERPTEFKGAGMVIMKRGPFELTEEERREREKLAALPLQDRVVYFLEQCIAAVPKTDVRPREGESEIVIGEKLTTNVKFQTFYQGMIDKMGPEVETYVKELVIGVRNLAAEPGHIASLIESFKEKMKAAGLISDEDESQSVAPAQQSRDSGAAAVVGSAPQEVLSSKEAMSKFISGRDEPLAPIDDSLYVKVDKQEVETKPESNVVSPSLTRVMPDNALIVGIAIVVGVVAISAAAWFGRSSNQD